MEDRSTAWMLTFADLVSLMLTFFVMLFAMSSLKTDEWNNLASSLSRRLTIPDEPITQRTPGAAFNIGADHVRAAEDLDYLTAVLQRHIARAPAFAGASVSRGPDRVVISIPTDALFDGGPATAVTAAGRGLLAGLAGILLGTDNALQVEARVAPIPSAADGTADLARLRATWQLALARAVAAANILNRAGIDRRVSAHAAAHGDIAGGARPDVVDVVILPRQET